MQQIVGRMDSYKASTLLSGAAFVLVLRWKHAGTVSGVQASLQSAFEVMSFLVGALINRPQQFHWLMAGSCAAACAAAGLFQTYACRQRAR